MTEKWVRIPGTDHYEVSNEGRVRSLDRTICDKNGVESLRPGRILKTPVASNGYPMVYVVGADGRSRNRTVHTLVAEAFLGPRPDGMQVRHVNGVREDVRLSNLMYGTPKENESDKVAHGTYDARRRPQERCKRNHPLVEGNLYVTTLRDGRTRRQCKKCCNMTSTQSQRRAAARKREADVVDIH